MNVSSACVRSGSSRFRLMYDSTVGADFKRRSWSAHGSEHDGHRMLGLRLAIVCRWLHNYDVTYVPGVVDANIFPRCITSTHYLQLFS